MTLHGGCYCGALRYESTGDPILKAQCHCRECQYISGGGPNFFTMLPKDGFRYVSGTPQKFARADLEKPVTREFCGTCGTHVLTRIIGRDYVVLKVGTLDDPSWFEAPQIAIFTVDKQPFHVLADGLPAFERIPPQPG